MDPQQPGPPPQDQPQPGPYSQPGQYPPPPPHPGPYPEQWGAPPPHPQQWGAPAPYPAPRPAPYPVPYAYREPRIIPAPPGTPFHRLARTPKYTWWRPIVGTLLLGAFVLFLHTGVVVAWPIVHRLVAGPFPTPTGPTSSRATPRTSPSR